MKPGFSSLTPDEPAPVAQSNVGAFNFIIRPAQVKDLTGMAEILADSFHPPTGGMRWAYPLLRMGIYEDLRSRLRSTSPNQISLVAISQATPQNLEYLAGTVEMALRSPPAWSKRNAYLYISNLAVRRSCRRQGVAHKLLLACGQTALKWGFKDIYLHVLENNHQARRLYLKAGYQVKEIEPSFSFLFLRQPRRLFLHKHLELLA